MTIGGGATRERLREIQHSDIEWGITGKPPAGCLFEIEQSSWIAIESGTREERIIALRGKKLNDLLMTKHQKLILGQWRGAEVWIYAARPRHIIALNDKNIKWIINGERSVDCLVYGERIQCRNFYWHISGSSQAA